MKKTAVAEVLPTVYGTPFGGGIYLGRFFHDAEPFALIGAPKSTGEKASVVWNKSTAMVKGALSVYDGLSNTKAMDKAGSALAKWALGLKIGGFKDWYLPSRGELLLAYAADVEGAEAFEKSWYWSSTQYAGDEGYAWCQTFHDGNQYDDPKNNELRARAVRRLKL